LELRTFWTLRSRNILSVKETEMTDLYLLCSAVMFEVDGQQLKQTLVTVTEIIITFFTSTSQTPRDRGVKIVYSEDKSCSFQMATE
jgi:hypothetical protein